MRNNMHPTTAPLYRPSRNNRRVRPREEYGKSDIRKTTRKMENRNKNINNKNNNENNNESDNITININNNNNNNNNSSHSHNRGHVENENDYDCVYQHASQRIHRSLSASVSSSSLSLSSSSRSPDRAGASTNHPPKRHPHPTLQNARYSRAQSPPTQRTEPSSAPSSSSSSKKKKQRNVMIYLKHLILRCFLARRQRKLRRMMAAKRMQQQRCNSFGSEDENENEYSSPQMRTTVPSNETEMYVMLRSKRTNGSFTGHHNHHYHNHNHDHDHNHPSSSRHPSRTIRNTNHGCESNRHHGNHHHYHQKHKHKHPSTPVTNRQRRTYSDDGHTRQSFSALSLAPRTRASTTGSVSPHQVFLDELRSEDRDSMRSLL